MTAHVAYRHAAYDSPWWANSDSRHGRFHRALEHPTQYLSLHPFGPAAEMLRHNVGPAGMNDTDTVVLNLWAMIIEADGIIDINFDNCAGFGITPEELVGDDYGPTQALAGQLRGHASGISVPSAALPGTENLVLFGPRVTHPYLITPITPEECRTGHLTDGGRSPGEVVDLVRWIGTPHLAMERWKKTGAYIPLDDPLPKRW